MGVGGKLHCVFTLPLGQEMSHIHWVECLERWWQNIYTSGNRIPAVSQSLSWLLSLLAVWFNYLHYPGCFYSWWCDSITWTTLALIIHGGVIQLPELPWLLLFMVVWFNYLNYPGSCYSWWCDSINWTTLALIIHGDVIRFSNLGYLHQHTFCNFGNTTSVGILSASGTKISYSMLNCFGLLMLICFVILRWRLTESTVTMVTMETKSDLHQRCQLSVVWPLSHGPILIIFGTAPPMFILKLLQTFRITVCIPWWVMTATQHARARTPFL